jgi:triosephosphate isomerase
MKKLPAGRPHLVIANWKMNPITEADAGRLARAIVKKASRPRAQVVIAPPAAHLAAVRAALSKSFGLGAQDGHERDTGPLTGNISLRTLYSYGVRTVILGHSERRKEGETDARVNAKVRAALLLGITPVVCIGELTRDHHGKYFSTVEAQLRATLSGVKRSEIERVVIAYEPVWAISSGDGKGQTATPGDAHEMKLFIQKILVELYGRTSAMRVRIIYGGSVNRANAEDLVVKGEVDGFLVGGASLKPDEFADIIKAAS